MDFRNILQSLSTITEGETKETEKGRVHKGSYGRHFDTDEEGDEKKAKKPEVKRGRGRPKKDSDESGEVKKYDTKSLGSVFGGGQKPKKEVGKVSKKHSLKEYIEEVATTKTQIDEAEQISIAPAQQNTQVIKQGNKTLGTVTNPQLAQQIKQSIGKGEMTLAGSDLTDEGVMDTLKKVGSTALNKLGHGSDEQLLKQLQQKMGAQGAQVHGKPSMAIPNQKQVQEKAPPGAKAERMVKHIKKSYAKDGKITPKEKSIAYATAWKAHNKGKVEESAQDDNEILTEGAFMNLAEYLNDVLHSDKHRVNFEDAVMNKDMQKAQRIIRSIMSMDDNFRRRPHTLKTQLEDYCLEESGLTNYEESLMDETILPNDSREIARTSIDSVTGKPTREPFKPSRIQGKPLPIEKPTPWSADPVNAFTDRAINTGAQIGRKVSGFVKGLKKPTFESTNMKDIQLENWEKQLNSLLTEGITVSSSTGQQGAPDSVSITASDADAQTLLGVLRNAGIGMFGGDEQPALAYGVASQGEEEPTGTGTEPQPAPDVADGDDMLSLIKKMTGIDMGGSEEGSDDYEDEEGEEQMLEPADSGEEESDDEEKTDEGNAFTGALAKAKSDGVQPGEKMKVGGKEYPVKEDDVEEGNKFTGNLAKARAAGKKEADLDGDGDMEKVHEGEEMCNECGGSMYEGHSCGHDQVEENFANDAGGDAMADTELAKLKALLSMGNDLHKMKSSRTVGNPTQVSVAEALTDWKKLSGIK